MSQKNSRNNGNSQSNGKVRKLKINEKIELTDKQKKFLDIGLSKNTNLMFGIGPAGTAKTYLSVLCALKLINMKTADSLLYIRSVVESSEHKLGFLPGEEAIKLEPYLRPLKDKLTEFLSKTEISYMWSNDLIEMEHVGFCRGQDWKNKMIIIDEAQNLTFKELLTLITRYGEKSKMFIIGDPMQSDIAGHSGFMDFYNIFDNSESKNHKIQCFQFTNEDIVRSELIKYIVEICQKYNKSTKQ